MRFRTLIPDWLTLIVDYLEHNQSSAHMDSIVFDWEIRHYPGSNWVVKSYHLQEWSTKGITRTWDYDTKGRRNGTKVIL